jgi:serine/threonine protein kinase/Tfp pilus assembly protein PilF
MTDSTLAAFAAPDPASRLRRLWQQGQRPDVRSFIDSAGTLTPDQIIDVLWVDREQRRQAGQCVSAECYFEMFPTLLDDPEKAVELVYGEFLLREEFGDNPDLEEFLKRFPGLAGRLREQVDLHRAMAEEAKTEVKEIQDSGSEIRLQPKASPRGGWPQIPGFEIVRELGRGGMGVVYQAWQPRLRRFVAVKLVLTGPHSGDPERVRFETEVEAVARLQHAHIVQIYDVGDHDGQPFFTMEFVDGGSLSQKLRGDPQPADTAAELVEHVARAMHHAHTQGIVHRDLKPGNILLKQNSKSDTQNPKRSSSSNSDSEPVSSAVSEFSFQLSDYSPKITDFGLAKLVVGGGVDQTKTGSVMGTAAYMAPEQAGGKGKEATASVDIYALGVILYELLAGHTPFRGATTLDTLQQVLFQEPVPPRRLQPKVPRDLETICLKCLEKSPNRRYSCALELADDLARFRRGEPIHARPVPPWERCAKWIRRRPTFAAALLTSAVVVIGSIVGSLIHLNIALNHARTEWKHETDRARRAERRFEGQELVYRAESAARSKVWKEVALHAEEVFRRIGDEEELSDLRERAVELRDQAKQHLDDEVHFTQFEQHRRDALSRWGLLFGGGSLADHEKVQEAARAALEEFHVDPETGDALSLSDSYTKAQQTAIVGGCYELLLMLADAVASPSPGKSLEESHGQTRQAIRILRRAARLGLATQAYHRRLAVYYKRLGDETHAREASTQSAATSPAGALDYFLSGLELYQSSQFAQSGSEFERILLKQPDHFWALFYHSLCQLRLHRADAAVAGFNACLGQERSLVWLYVQRALANTERNEFAAADEDFQAALDHQPDKDARYSIHVSRASLRRLQNRLEEAATELNAAIPLRPEPWQARLSLAQVYRSQKNWKDAREQVRLAMSESPGLAVLYRERARLASDMNDPVAATDDYRKAIECETTSPANRAEDHIEIAKIHQRAQKTEDALKEYDAALQEQPGKQQALRGRAESLLELKRYPEAAPAFDQYLKVGPPSAEVLRKRATARTKTEDYMGAVEDYDHAIRLEPSAALYTRRGLVYLEMSAFKPARLDFEKALKLGPETGDMYAGLGYALVQSGELDLAIKYAEKAIQLGPKDHLHFYSVARIYSQALAKLSGMDGRREMERRLDYQEEAYRLIYLAHESLPPSQRRQFWKDTIRNDSAIKPLRQNSKKFHDLEKAQGLGLNP